MSYADQFLNNFIRQKLLGIHTAMPAKVISFDEATKQATIQPLYMSKEVDASPSPLPLIQGVPALSQRFKVGDMAQTYEPIYQAGDIVFVAFSERALDSVLAGGGRPVLPDSTRHHDLNDAVILGVLI